MKKHSSRSRLPKLLTLLILAFLPVIIFWQRNSLYDAWRLHGYQPPAEIAGLASQTKMTDSARHIFYVNQPKLINDAQTFRGNCTIAEQTIVLGCYRSPEVGIYVYNVQDDRLAGIQQVTAAHEMLHAAYDRLSSKDRNYVNGLLLDYYQNELKDSRILATIDSYKKTEPKDVVNEMHSIFGTEIASLPPSLETYYQRYFSDRSTVVGQSANYEKEFTTREDSAKKLEAQLNSLLPNIKSVESTLKGELSSINAERARLDSQRNSNPDAYNAAVASFNDQIDGYNTKVARYQADVKLYNQLLKQYNQIAGDLRSLYSSIDTSVQATSSQ